MTRSQDSSAGRPRWRRRPAALAASLLAAVAALAAQQQPPAPATPPQQPTDVGIRITGEPGTPPRLAVPDLIALSPDKETQDAAKVIGEVLWDDMEFEREFYICLLYTSPSPRDS